MNEQGRNEADISRYTDVEYSPEGYKTVYRWGDFLEIAGGASIAWSSAGRHVGFFTVSSRTSRNLAIISAPGEISLLSRRKRREKRAARPARGIAIPNAHEGSQGVIKCN